MAEGEPKTFRERIGLDYLLERKCPPHQFEPTTYYLLKKLSGEWNENSMTRNLADLRGARVKICKICKGVFAE